MTGPLPPVADEANDLLAPAPAKLATGMSPRPGGGMIGVVTVRTTSATVTVFLQPGEVKEWADLLNGLHAQMGAGGLVIPAPGAAAQLDAMARGARRNANGGG
jgi:hypothetical protein